MAEGTSVVIDGENFALDGKPATSSALVKNAKQEVLGEIDLDLLTQSLSRVGKFIYLAYNGVTGDSGNKIKIQKVGIHVTKLSDDSALMVHRYGNMARDVLQELQASYQYLFDGLEEVALDAIFQISAMAQQMADQTGELRNAFELIETEIIDVVMNLQKKRTEDKKIKTKLDEESKKIDEDIKRYEELKKSAKEAYDKAALYYYQAHAKDEDAAFDLSNIFNAVMNVTSTVAILSSAASKGGFGSMVTAGLSRFFAKYKPSGKKGKDKTLSHKTFAEEKTKYVQEMKKQRDLERKSLSSFEDIASKIASYRPIGDGRSADDSKLADAAILAMHCAIGAVKQIVAVLTNAMRFWRQIQDNCGTLRTEAAQEQVKAAAGNDKTKRMFSDAFKQQAVKYYSQWVALESVCTLYNGDIQNTRAELQKYMKENPTIEDSQKNLTELAKSLAKDLSDAKAALDEKDRQAEQEMRKLADMKEVKTYPK